MKNYVLLVTLVFDYGKYMLNVRKYICGIVAVDNIIR